jgi:spore germination protein GerM
MQDQNKNRFPITMIAAITGIILAAGGGVAWWTKSNLEQTTKNVQPVPSPIEQAETDIPAPEAITQEKMVQICWLNPTGEKIELVSSSMTFKKSVKPERVLQAAVETLLAQPPADAKYTTAIPPGTKLLSLAVDQTGIHLDLSQEFTSGGGSASMSSRLAQIIYTVSTTSDREPIWISVEGKPLENLGEEGIMISQPMTKEKFNQNFEGFSVDQSAF